MEEAILLAQLSLTEEGPQVKVIVTDQHRQLQTEVTTVPTIILQDHHILQVLLHPVQ